jgi:hypothetical protein
VDEEDGGGDVDKRENSVSYVTSLEDFVCSPENLDAWICSRMKSLATVEGMWVPMPTACMAAGVQHGVSLFDDPAVTRHCTTARARKTPLAVVTRHPSIASECTSHSSHSLLDIEQTAMVVKQKNKRNSPDPKDRSLVPKQMMLRLHHPLHGGR